MPLSSAARSRAFFSGPFLSIDARERGWGRLATAHRPIHFPLRLPFLDVLPSVFVRLAAAQPQLHLRPARLEIQQEGDDGIASLAHLRVPPVDLLAVQEQLAAPQGLVGEEAGGVVDADVGVEQIQLAALGQGIGVREVGRPGPERLHLAAREHQAGLHLLVHGVAGASLAILRDDPDAALTRPALALCTRHALVSSSLRWAGCRSTVSSRRRPPPGSARTVPESRRKVRSATWHPPLPHNPPSYPPHAPPPPNPRRPPPPKPPFSGPPRAWAPGAPPPPRDGPPPRRRSS